MLARNVCVLWGQADRCQVLATTNWQAAYLELVFNKAEEKLLNIVKHKIGHLKTSAFFHKEKGDHCLYHLGKWKRNKIGCIKLLRWNLLAQEDEELNTCIDSNYQKI